jgi:hypothetical protein
MNVSLSVWISSAAAAFVFVAAPAVALTDAPPPTATGTATATATATATPTATVTATSTPTPVPVVAGYVGILDIEASLPALAPGGAAPPEAQSLLGRLKDKAQLKTRIYLSRDLSRQEVVSTDFVLPAGTVILHEAGARFYVIADPKEKTYVVMEADGIMSALEGGLGIVNSEYQASVKHTLEKKPCGAFGCRKSLVTVKYVSTIPFENDKVFVQQANELEVWHTSDLLSSALLDQFFFKFDRDRTETVQKLVKAELGFPMEMTLTVQPPPSAKRATVSAGTVHIAVSDLRVDKKMDAELLRIPPAGYRRLDRNPYFKNAAATP